MTATFAELPAPVQARLLKVFALATAGADGEREAAAAILEKLLAGHRLTMDALLAVVGAPRDHFVRCPVSDNAEKEILLGLVSAITDSSGPVWTRGKRSKLEIARLTAAEAAELTISWPILRAAYRRVLHEATVAFMLANRLYGPTDPDRPRRKATPAEEEERRRIRALASVIPAEIRHGRLGAGPGVDK